MREYFLQQNQIIELKGLEKTVDESKYLILF